MDVASNVGELPENFWFSDEEMFSAPKITSTEPDESEVAKDPQVTCQTRSSSSHAETPAADAQEPARIPPTTKVHQSPSIARPSTVRPFAPQSSTVQQSATSQPTTTPPTDSPSQTDAPVEPMSQFERWLPRQRKRGVRCSPTCWNPDTAEKKGQVLTPCTQDEVVEVAFALSHHEAIKIAETPATALAALARQGRG